MPLFGALCFIFAGGLKESLLWFLFYVSLGCILLTLLYYFRRWTSLAITRSFNSEQNTLEAGSNIRVVLKTEIFSFLPLPWLEVRDRLPRRLKKHASKPPLCSLAWARKGDVQHTSYLLSDIPRGIHNWEALEFESGDPLGFMAYQGQLQNRDRLVVYPKTIELPASKFFPRRAEGMIMSRRNFNPSQVELVGIREYQPGDKLSLIDWKSTAKTGRLLAKEFRPLLMSFSLVALDCTQGTWERGDDPAFEQAVTVAASLVKAAVGAHIPTRFLSNYSRQRGQIAVSSRAEYYNLLGHMAGIDYDGPDIIDQYLYKELFIRDNNIVLVSSQRGARLRKTLHLLSVRGNVVTLIMVNSFPGAELDIKPRRTGSYNELVIDKAGDLQAGDKKWGVG